MKRVEFELGQFAHCADKNAEKLYQAVLELLVTDGHSGVTLDNVVKSSGLGVSTIERSFGSLNGLKESFIERMLDKVEKEQLFQPFQVPTGKAFGCEVVGDYLERLMVPLYKNLIYQKVLIWSYGERSTALDKVRSCWEGLQEELFKQSEAYFVGTGIDYRTGYAQCIGGVFYLFQLDDGNPRGVEGLVPSSWNQQVCIANNLRSQVCALFKEADDQKKARN
ncbi:MAG: TetR/AcrR family transcriptional regulator [Chitinophaga sp.]|uniref:TetR/AcrR family transcriptional regulator n=1 Tax=Chitinophaga sp. TaxID=1869181 RepID=UPI0025B7CE66|nr:hypothetical protein [Chitinophaga sp.]MBV8251424.1 TetR/AcrR family transcriptional regulator [Chitinophaga sp.]